MITNKQRQKILERNKHQAVSPNSKKRMANQNKVSIVTATDQPSENTMINESAKNLLGFDDPPIIQQSIDLDDYYSSSAKPAKLPTVKAALKRTTTDTGVQEDNRNASSMTQLTNGVESVNVKHLIGYKGGQQTQSSFAKNQPQGNVFVRSHNLADLAPNQTRTGTSNQRYTGQTSGDRSTAKPSDTSTAIWKDKYDHNQLYNLKKKLSFTDPLDDKRREIQRFNSQDIKGSRRTLYMKEVQTQNQDILTVVNISRLEQVNNYTDGHKCLPFRKRILRFRVHVTNFAQMITTSRYFEAFIILIIGLNCITLAQSDSTMEETPTQKRIELAFQTIYTIEMVLRIFSLGFILKKGSYLRSPWNQLDFITVMTGFLEMFGGGDTSLAGLRAFRVLRPLRTINQIEGLRIVVQSVMAAIPLLQDTILILVFFMLIFAIGGLNLFMGMLMQRCVNIDTGMALLDDEGEEIICSDGDCPPGFFCGKRTLNPQFDVTNFDNIFWALLNVFQCITLEGWSDIMVMYQKSYTPIVFFFFVSLVFIGAFFFLNLTLAVINSSYSEAQARIKAQKEKLKLEQLNMIMSSESNTGSTDKKKRGERAQLGLTEFFLAKKAAVKLLKYWKDHEREKENKKSEVEQNARDEKDALKLAQINERKRKQAMLKKQKQRLKLQPKSPTNGSVGTQGNDDGGKSEPGIANTDKPNEVKMMDLGLSLVGMQDMKDIFNGSVNKGHISEEEDEEGDRYSDDVQQFLQEIGNGVNESQRDRKISTAQRQRQQEGAGPINAFLDVRIAGASPLKNRNDVGDGLNKVPSRKFISQTKNDEEDSEQDQQHVWMLKELDFDAVVGQKTENEATKKQSQTVPMSARILHLSPRSNNMMASNGFELQKPILNPIVNVDDLPENGQGGSVDNIDALSNFPSSIISSDESIGQHLQNYQQMPAAQSKPDLLTVNQSRMLRRDKLQEKEIQSKQIGTKLRRMLTGGDFTVDHNRSREELKTQIDLMSSLQLNNSALGKHKRLGERTPQLIDLTKPNAMKSVPTNDTREFNNLAANTSIHESTQGRMRRLAAKDARQDTLDVYRKIDEEKWFDIDAPKNTVKLIDKQQKVLINPGVPYVSTSQDEIFERRILNNQKENFQKVNQFIKAPATEAQEQQPITDRYQSTIEDIHITSGYSPYQLKTVYKIKKLEEIEWNDDDEDALILSQQPFETVMQVGFKDFLNHLSTKFIARRSDIIVSSTLSITLTPEDDGFVPVKFGLINPDEINNYIQKRQVFRAIGITSNTCPRKQLNHASSQDLIASFLDPSESEEEDENDISIYKDVNETGQSNEEIKLGKALTLPPTLLTEPLSTKKEAMLRGREKKLYNLQKSKYEVIQKSISKKAVHPADTVFSLDEARQLIQGSYHLDDDELFAANQPNLDQNYESTQENKAIKRAMNNGIKEFKHELILENFEEKIVLQEEKLPTIGANLMNKRDNIPQEFKEAFNLPDDMRSYDIDFSQVRTTDSMFKKRLPEWSGQDVLDINLNNMKSNWVVDKMSKVRVWPKGSFNPVKKARYILKSLTRTSLFENFLTVCVLANTIGMAMTSYDIEKETEESLEFQNNVFTWIFIVEMTIKLLARGPQKYSAERMNLIDGAVVILSIIEIIMQSVGGGGSAGNLQSFRTVRIFRTFRVLRVTRILRSLQSMAMIIGVIQRAFMDFILITVLMFVFIFIYTLLGRQIFQGNYEFGPDETLPRENFESFTVAFVTVFQVLTMENWQSVLFVSMRAAQGSMIFKTVTAVFYISWIFIGNFILLNLFLAILIDSFGEADAELEMTDEQRELEEQKQEENRKRLQAEKEKRMKKLGTSMKQLSRMKSIRPVKAAPKKKSKASFTGGKRLFNENLIEEVEDLDNNTIRLLLIRQGLLKAKPGEIDHKEVGPEIHAENSVYLFGRHSCFRRNAHYIQKHRYFERFIMLLIALSSTKLALESYIRDEPLDSPVVQISGELDFAFNYLFIVEMCFKIVALGFAMDDGSYLRDGWNGLDFFIVVTSIIDMALTNTDIPALKVLRLLRMIRPLRVISHNPQLKMIVAALFESVGSIFNVSVVVIIIWLMFAIYGMNTYMGMFFYCSEQPYKYNTKWVCEDHGGEWLRFDSNFDDIGQAMVTLFIVSSLEGWPDIMYQAIDITKRDNGPKYENAPAQSAFFIVFILIGSFFFLNFFIGVLFLKYEQAQKKEEAGFNKKQLYWLEIQQLVMRAQTPHELRYRPTEDPRLTIWEILRTNVFEVTIMICIVTNMLQMALDHEGRSGSMTTFLQVSNYFFTAIFLFEALIKLYVYRLAYFKTAWNKFDFFVVISSLIDLGLELSLPTPDGGQADKSNSEILTVGPQLARVLRVLRVSRVLRLANQYEGLQKLLKTITMSVSSLFNVFILLMLIFFIMAVLGNTLFFEVTEGVVIDEWKNFTNFHMSFSLLFSISTGEDWNRIMYDCIDTSASCIPGKTCGSSFGVVFFLTFIVLVSYIMLNLFILVIIQQFSKYYLEDDNPLSRFEEDFEDFKKAWELYTDKYQCTKISVKNLDKFFTKLPIRIRKKVNLQENARNVDMQRIIIKMGITVDEGFIYFNEMLYRLMRAQFGNVKMNKVMALNELVTQFRITEQTMLAKQENMVASKQSKEKLKENIFFSQLRAASANPFLTKMWYRMSFKTWQKYVRSVVQRQLWEREVDKDRQIHKSLGKTFIEPTFENEKQEFEEVEIERELIIEMSCSSDEDGNDTFDSKSRRSGSYSLRNSLARQQSISPEDFRKKARQRIDVSMRKFNSSEFKLEMNKTADFGSSSYLTPQKDVKIGQTSKMVNGQIVGAQTHQMLALSKKFNKNQRRTTSIELGALGIVSESNDEYKGNFKKKEVKNSPKSGLNGPFSQKGKK